MSHSACFHCALPVDPRDTYYVEIDGEQQPVCCPGCKAVAEGANMPATLEAIDLFREAQVLFAPGKAANAGGVAISGLEMTQNSMRLSWAADELEDRLQAIMRKIHQQCVSHGEDPSGYMNYVKGANIAGFIKVADAMLAYGVA